MIFALFARSRGSIAIRVSYAREAMGSTKKTVRQGRVKGGVYRTKRGEKGEIGEQMRSTIAKPDVLRLLIPGMADSIIHRFANSSNIGGVAVALQPLRHLSS